MNQNKTQTVSMSFPQGVIEKLDKLMATGDFGSRSEVVRMGVVSLYNKRFPAYNKSRGGSASDIVDLDSVEISSKPKKISQKSSKPDEMVVAAKEKSALAEDFCHRMKGTWKDNRCTIWTGRGQWYYKYVDGKPTDPKLRLPSASQSKFEVDVMADVYQRYLDKTGMFESSVTGQGPIEVFSEQEYLDSHKGGTLDPEQMKAEGRIVPPKPGE